MIHLDTNFLVQALISNSVAASRLQAWRNDGEDLGISTIVWSEFLCGPLDHDDEKLAQLLFPSPEPFLVSDAHTSAKLFNATGRRSRSLADCQIAAIALRCDAGLATGNISDFTPFQSFGLTLV
jgi:predicted nucleic acid-binding protein